MRRVLSAILSPVPVQPAFLTLANAPALIRIEREYCRPVVVVVCAYCPRPLVADVETRARQENPAVKITHGMCGPCFQRETAAILGDSSWGT